MWASFVAKRNPRQFQLRYHFEAEEPTSPINTFSRLLISSVQSPLSEANIPSSLVLSDLVQASSPRLQGSSRLIRACYAFVPKVVASLPTYTCTSRRFQDQQFDLLHNRYMKAQLLGIDRLLVKINSGRRPCSNSSFFNRSHTVPPGSIPRCRLVESRATGTPRQ